MIHVSRTIRTLDNIFQTSACHSNLDSKVFLASMLLCSNCSGKACNKLKSGWIWMVYDGMTSTMSNMYITEKHVVHADVTSHSSKKNNTKRASHINVPFSILFSTFSSIFTHFPTNCSFLSGPNCPDCPDCASSRSSLLLRSCKDFASKVITKRSKSLQFSCLERQQNLLQEQPSKIHQAHSH